MKVIESVDIAGDAIRAAKTRITPITRVVHLRIPGLPVVFSWKRPVAVEVDEDGTEVVLPVQDLTRRWQLAFVCLGLAAPIFIWRVMRKKHRRL